MDDFLVFENGTGQSGNTLRARNLVTQKITVARAVRATHSPGSFEISTPYRSWA